MAAKESSKTWWWN